MKKIYLTLIALLATTGLLAQGWPANYGGVMLQGFYWDSYRDSKWTRLEAQASELGQYFNLVWIPQSAYCGGKSMGYDDLYWFSNYDSSFGNEAELRSLIKTFRANGIGTIADVVVNHRKTLASWTDFPVETYKGNTYEMLSTDICADDDGGKTKEWADKNGVSLSGNKDSGEDWAGMRDLDHSSTNVQTIVKAYLDMLLNDFGYAGFRYDMVKGYSGKYTADYNSAAQPAYSVGEYWDGKATVVKNWIDATKVDGTATSAAFDFPIRYAVRDAIAANWSDKVNTDVLAGDKDYRQYAVTFVENHDTEYRSASEQQDPIRKDTLAANAYIMAACGTPCVFYKHWMDYKKDIKMMINARRLVGITNTSNTTFNAYSGKGYNGLATTGEISQLLAVVGPGVAQFATPAAYVEILSGYHYRYFVPKKANLAWVDLPSGEYEAAQKAKLVAVSNDGSAQLVYTTDGTEPTADSRKAKSGEEVEIPLGETTLKVGLLVNGAVSGILTRTYKVSEPVAFEPYDITVYVNASGVDFEKGYANFWAWSDSPKSENITVKGSWPGDKITRSKEIDGKTWYYNTYRIKSEDYTVSLVFSTKTGTPQTVDFTDVTKDAYLEIVDEKDASGHYKIKDVTAEMAPTGITDSPEAERKASADNAWYTLMGLRMARKPAKVGIYLHQGKKMVVR